MKKIKFAITGSIMIVGALICMCLQQIKSILELFSQNVEVKTDYLFLMLIGTLLIGILFLIYGMIDEKNDSIDE